MDYRPANWEELARDAIVKTISSPIPLDGRERAYVEAGADAIIEGLRKEGVYCNPCSLQRYWGKKGWLIFIEDAEIEE